MFSNVSAAPAVVNSVTHKICYTSPGVISRFQYPVQLTVRHKGPLSTIHCESLILLLTSNTSSISRWQCTGLTESLNELNRLRNQGISTESTGSFERRLAKFKDVNDRLKKVGMLNNGTATCTFPYFLMSLRSYDIKQSMSVVQWLCISLTCAT